MEEWYSKSEEAWGGTKGWHHFSLAFVTQLDYRVPAYEAGSWRFESSQMHQFYQRIIS